MSATTASARPLLLLPELDRLWIRHAPRSREWRDHAPVGELLWFDLAAGEIGESGRAGVGDESDRRDSLPGLAGPFDDVLYLPPVAPAFAAARDAAAAAHAALGTPVLLQALPGDEPSEAWRRAGVVVVHDLLGPLLRGDVDGLADPLPVSGHAVALWPLIPGLTDGAERADEGCRRLAAAGFTTVQGVAPDLPAARRRQLYEHATVDRPGEEADALFQLLFHGPGADARGFARVAHRHGLRPFLPRPLPRPPLTGAGEREIAGLLAFAGELCLRLGSVGRGQAYLRAARWIDRTDYDLRALAREGNLSVLPWLDDEGRKIVEEWAEEGESASVVDLLAEYAAGS